VQTEGIYPEAIVALGIARGDMPGDTFIKTKFGEEAKSGSEPFLAVTAFLGG
jgi:hypothetical protein